MQSAIMPNIGIEWNLCHFLNALYRGVNKSQVDFTFYIDVPEEWATLTPSGSSIRQH
jgi:hypothetical protein